MNGILVGVLATLGTLAVLRALRVLAWRRRWRHRGAGRGWMARRLLRRLEATPGQERLFLEEIESLRAVLRETRQGLFASREELARALEAEAVDPTVLEALGARELARVDAVRRRASDALARFHASLDARQRQVLAELVRSRGRPSPRAAC